MITIMFAVIMVFMLQGTVADNQLNTVLYTAENGE
jgi:hypothetical protein